MVTPLHRNRDFVLLWSGQVVSSLGSAVSSIAFPLLVLALTGSPARAGIVGFAGTLPFLLFQLPAGGLVDRWDRKRTMIVSDALRGVALGSIAVAYAAGVLTFAQIVAVAFAEGTLFVLFMLAERTALPHLVAPEQLPAALAQNEARTRGATLAGNPLGGILFGLGHAVPFAANAASYLVSMVSLFFVRSDFQEERPPSTTTFHKDIAEGLVWLRRQPFLRAAALLVASRRLPFHGGFARDSRMRYARFMSPDHSSRPWEHAGMRIEAGRLLVAGRDAEALAREHGTPLYVYDLQRVAEAARALQDALGRAGLRHRVRLALKALREPALLHLLRRLGPPGEPPAVGLDACSPGEVLHALECGFLPEEISYTGTNLSERDLDVIAPLPLHINVDLLTQIDRVGRRCPGRVVGLRINPRAGVMRGHAQSLYSGAGPTKFGIYDADLEEAVGRAASRGLTIDAAHFHLANGMLDDELPAFDEALSAAGRMVRRLIAAGCPLEEVNVGGGLGTPLHAGERPLDLDAYAGILARHFGDLGVAVGVEPGEFLTNEAGLLLAEVVTVEKRMGTTFVGLDCGWNVMNDHRIYGRELEFVACDRADTPPARRVIVAGHINEGDDLFGEDVPFPDVAEGDIIAMVSVGGYCQCMWTDHCGRPRAVTLFFEERV